MVAKCIRLEVVVVLTQKKAKDLLQSSFIPNRKKMKQISKIRRLRPYEIKYSWFGIGRTVLC